MKATWYQPRDPKDEWHFEIQADDFLYRMVRRLVFVQVAAAQGKVAAETIVHSLADKAWAEQLPAGLAPAHGLALVEVAYANPESMDH
jgi:tRNA pseudouridine38-40 synthase